MSFHMHNMYNMNLNSICKICIIICNIICTICQIICKICKNDNMQNNMQFNMHNMQAICRFGADCLVLTVICRICQIICSICPICYDDFQYAQYALPTLLMCPSHAFRVCHIFRDIRSACSSHLVRRSFCFKSNLGLCELCFN